MTSLFLLAFLTALLLSFIFTRIVRDVAVARGWVVAPASDRHIHVRPTPRLGGVAIFLSSIIVGALLWELARRFQLDLGLESRTLYAILGCGTLIFLLGLYDDVCPAKPYVKFVVQGIAATLLFSQGLQVTHLPLFFGSLDLGWVVSLLLTILWVLGITNAFNLIDGLDGLAAGSGLFSTLTVFVVSLASHNNLVSILTIALAGAILGFLRYNFNPATIFLGDSGSLFIGFTLSALALAGSQKTPTVVAVAIPVVSFGLPILETALSVLRRWLNGQPLFTADREHIHHKLLDRGFSQRQVVVILYGVSALCGLLSLFLLYPQGQTLGIVLFVLGAGIWIGVQHLGYHELFELGRVAQRTIEQKKIIINNLSIRRATWTLSKVKDLRELRAALVSAFEATDFDGFELDLGPPCINPGDDGGRFENWQTVEYRYRWLRSDADSDRLRTNEWNLTLELITSKRRKLGQLSLYRVYTDKHLLIDINLLISSFPVALADAADRVMNRPESYAREILEPVHRTLAGSALPSDLRDQRPM